MEPDSDPFTDTNVYRHQRSAPGNMVPAATDGLMCKRKKKCLFLVIKRNDRGDRKLISGLLLFLIKDPPPVALGLGLGHQSLLSGIFFS